MIIAAFNPKGGTGKTTTAVNVASALAGMGRSVLLVDLEADLNASISLGVRPRDVHLSIAELLLHDARPADAVRPTGVEQLWLITGSPALASIEGRLRNVRQPERRLADIVKPLAQQYDDVILDAPAGYSTLALSVPVAADELVVPIRAEYLALESLARFLVWYRDRHEQERRLAHLAGILLTKVDYRRPATSEIVDMIRLHNRRGVFRTEIPDDPRVAEAPSHGEPLRTYAPRSGARRAYDAFASELVTRLAKRRLATAPRVAASPQTGD